MFQILPHRSEGAQADVWLRVYNEQSALGQHPGKSAIIGPDKSRTMRHDQNAMESYYAARAAEYDEIYMKPERQADLSAIRK